MGKLACLQGPGAVFHTHTRARRPRHRPLALGLWNFAVVIGSAGPWHRPLRLGEHTASVGSGGEQKTLASHLFTV